MKMPSCLDKLSLRVYRRQFALPSMVKEVCRLTYYQTCYQTYAYIQTHTHIFQHIFDIVGQPRQESHRKLEGRLYTQKGRTRGEAPHRIYKPKAGRTRCGAPHTRGGAPTAPQQLQPTFHREEKKLREEKNTSRGLKNLVLQKLPREAVFLKCCKNCLARQFFVRPSMSGLEPHTHLHTYMIWS